MASVTFRRARREQNAVAARKIYASACGRFRLLHSHIVFGNGELPDVWYAEILRPAHDGNGQWWDVLSKHRNRSAAEKAIQAAARKAGAR